jgi:hypothetical protein
MDSTIPTDLLKLKARLEAWRTTRTYDRQPIPEQFRLSALEMTGRYSPSLVRRVLKLDPWRLRKMAAKNPAPNLPQLAFFTLPPESAFPHQEASTSPTLTTGHLQIERPDGARLTLGLPTLDLLSINQICAEFLRA